MHKASIRVTFLYKEAEWELSMTLGDLYMITYRKLDLPDGLLALRGEARDEGGSITVDPTDFYDWVQRDPMHNPAGFNGLIEYLLWMGLLPDWCVRFKFYI